MKYIVSVSKTHIHRGNHQHRDNTKKHWHIYYYDEEGIFRTERVSFLQALYYKTQKRHRIRGICQNCGRIWLYFLKSKREKMTCSYCESEAGDNE